MDKITASRLIAQSNFGLHKAGHPGMNAGGSVTAYIRLLSRVTGRG